MSIEVLELFLEPALVGILIAGVCSVLGVFVVTKRVVFIGIALSEVSACGIAMGLSWGMPPLLAAILLTVPAALLLAYPFESARMPREAVLGVIFVFASCLTILVVAQSASGLDEVEALLYGNLLFASRQDLVISAAVLLPAVLYFLISFRPTLISFFDRETARVLGFRVVVWELLYFLVLALTVSTSSMVVGPILVFCYLVVGPCTGLLLSRRLMTVFLISVGSGLVATVLGMYFSFLLDWPTSQTIGAISCSLLVLSAGLLGLNKLSHLR